MSWSSVFFVKSIGSNEYIKCFDLKNIKILHWCVAGMEKRKNLMISSNIFGKMCKRIKNIHFFEIKTEAQKGGMKKYVKSPRIMNGFMKYAKEK